MSIDPSGPAYAAIDIGTNSVKLLVARLRDGVLEPVLQRAASPRVGRNLGTTGEISPAAFKDLMTALAGFLRDVEAAGARLVGTVATHAFRQARNGAPLLAEVSALLGSPCRILDGGEESRLGYLAVGNRHPHPRLVVLDIGGGSTEVTGPGAPGVSLPLGAVSMLEAWGRDPKVLRVKAAAAFGKGLGQRWEEPLLAVVGGTATALAMLELKLSAFDSAAIEGLELDAPRVTAAVDRLAGLDERGRAALPGMDRSRLDILVPGLCMLEAYLRWAGCRRFRVSDRGVRYGVILAALEAAGTSPEAHPAAPSVSAGP